METLWQDVRNGVRVLFNGRGVTALAIVALALGIGANTAIFSIVNGLLFRGLPYTHAERLVSLWETNPDLAWEYITVTVGAFDDWHTRAESFEAVSILDTQRYAVTGTGIPERVAGVTTSASFFDLMGVPPLLGRVYTEAEDKPGADHVAVISYALWQKRFGGDLEVCGKTIQLDGDSYTLLGVMPAGFEFPRATDLPPIFQLPPQTQVWTPARLTAQQIANRGSHTKAAIARLKPGVSLAQAQEEISAIAAGNEQQYPDSRGWGARLVPLKEQLVGKLRAPLLILLAAVGLVLLIACANVANLLLVRASARQKEMAVRTALGASRPRLVRQLLTESIMLALCGGCGALLLGTWGIDLLLVLSPANIPRKYEISVDGPALAFTFGVALLTGILFGLAPVFQVSSFNLNENLKDSARGSTGGRSRLRSMLVVTEVALSLVLLISAGLLIRSFGRLIASDPGFNPEHLAAINLSVSSSRYSFDGKQVMLFKQVLDKVREIPGVVSAGAVSELPLSGSDELDGFTVEGAPPPKTFKDEPLADVRFVDSGYFDVMQTPIVTGRAFTDYDRNGSQAVVIVNDSLVRRYFGGQDAIGKRLKLGGYEDNVPWATVVGVVRDIKHSGLHAEPGPQLYFPYQQIVWGHMVVVARAQGDAGGLLQPMREAVWAVDKDQPVTSARTMEDYMSDSLSQQRFYAVLLGSFAGLALILAAVGIYGVTSYTVTQQTQELGIRKALGAKRRDMYALVVGDAMKLAVSGVALGLAGAFGTTRAMAGLLFGVSTLDPSTFVLVPLFMVGVAFAAGFMPARRAANVDPMVALRYE